MPVSQVRILLALAMGPGRLYGAVRQMLTAELIEESSERPDFDMDDQRRRYHRLTDLGVRTLDAEVIRMGHLAQTARTRRAEREAKAALAVERE